MTPTILRITDSIIGIWWLYVLIRSLMTGYIGGATNLVPTRSGRPGQYWFLIFVFALMVLHFIGLAIVGQQR